MNSISNELSSNEQIKSADWGSFKFKYSLKWTRRVIIFGSKANNFDLFWVYKLDESSVSIKSKLRRYFIDELKLKKSKLSTILAQIYELIFICIVIGCFAKCILLPWFLTKLSYIRRPMYKSNGKTKLLSTPIILVVFSIIMILLLVRGSRFLSAHGYADPVEIRFLLEPKREIRYLQIMISRRLNCISRLMDTHRQVLKRAYTSNASTSNRSLLLRRNYISSLAKLLEVNYIQLKKFSDLSQIIPPNYTIDRFEQMSPILSRTTLGILICLVISTVIIWYEALNLTGIKDRYLMIEIFVMIILCHHPFMSNLHITIPLMIFLSDKILDIGSFLDSKLFNLRKLYSESKKLTHNPAQRFITSSQIQQANEILFEIYIKLDSYLLDMRRCSETITCLLSPTLLASMVLILQLVFMERFHMIESYKASLFLIIVIGCLNYLAIRCASASSSFEYLEKTCWSILTESKNLIERQHDSSCEIFSLKQWRHFVLYLHQNKREFVPRLYSSEITYTKILEYNFYFMAMSSIILSRSNLLDIDSVGW